MFEITGIFLFYYLFIVAASFTFECEPEELLCIVAGFESSNVNSCVVSFEVCLL